MVLTIINLSGKPYFGQGKVGECYSYNAEWTLYLSSILPGLGIEPTGTDNEV